MKKRIVISIVAVVLSIVIVIAFIHYGCFEYVLDERKIDRAENSYTVVVTLSIGPNALLLKPYEDIIQVKSDKTVTENTFRIIRWPNYGFIMGGRSYDDKIIKGKTKNLSDYDYDTLLDILDNSDFESIQNKIDGTIYCDGNSTYITIIDGDNLKSVGGQGAESTDERFKTIMDYILALMGTGFE